MGWDNELKTHIYIYIVHVRIAAILFLVGAYLNIKIKKKVQNPLEKSRKNTIFS